MTLRPFLMILTCKQAGVEVGDLLDEVCGEPVFESGQGKVNSSLLPANAHL